ncbi:MAG TPA: hypothetical protein VNG89_21510 [Vicinamibacterales bacterium]|nr:hypothetical protein [Vicinamibacterales bacterium]
MIVTAATADVATATRGKETIAAVYAKSRRIGNETAVTRQHERFCLLWPILSRNVLSDVMGQQARK